MQVKLSLCHHKVICGSGSIYINAFLHPRQLDASEYLDSFLGRFTPWGRVPSTYGIGCCIDLKTSLAACSCRGWKPVPWLCRP